MNYEIHIEGGFSGIPRVLKGEIDLEARQHRELFKALDAPADPIDPKVRDIIFYRFRIEEGPEVKEAVFNDLNIPGSLREFVEQVGSGGQT